jgi:hypothetical protein
MRVTNIRLDRYRFAAVVLDMVHNLLCVLVGMGVVDDDLCPTLGELYGNCGSDAAAAACHKGGFAVQAVGVGVVMGWCGHIVVWNGVRLVVDR